MFDSPPQCSSKRSWTIVWLWVLLIYTIIPFARVLQRFVLSYVDRTAFSILVYCAVASVVMWLAYIVFSRAESRQRSSLLWLIAIGASFAYISYLVRESAEEALHLVQYGVLSFLVFRALSHKSRDSGMYLMSTLVCLQIGTIDEVLQWIAPERFFDYRDIAINGCGSLLVQLFICFCIKPSFVGSAVSLQSVQTISRATVVQLVLLALCLSNTPERVRWYSEKIPGLSFLVDNPSTMAEYGYTHRDSQIGSFKSRLTMQELNQLDQSNAKQTAAVLEQFKDAKHYQAFLQKYPGDRAPFVHEMRVRLFRRDNHIMRAQKTKKPKRRPFHLAIADGEQKILEKYFPNTLAASSYALPQQTLAQIRGQAKPGKYHSPVGRHLITTFNDVVVWFIVAWASVVLWLFPISLKRRVDDLLHTPLAVADENILQ